MLQSKPYGFRIYLWMKDNRSATQTIKAAHTGCAGGPIYLVVLTDVSF